MQQKVMNLINSGIFHKATATDAKSSMLTDPSKKVKQKTLGLTLHSIRKITVSAFPLILNITIIPSMQLSRISERPGVSIFQLRMDNTEGGVWALWWHQPTLIMVHTFSLSRGVAKLICALSWQYYVTEGTETALRVALKWAETSISHFWLLLLCLSICEC